MLKRANKPGTHTRKESYRQRITRIKRITALLLCAAMLLPLLIFPTMAAGDTAFGVSITRDDGSATKQYYVGETAFFKIRVELSGLDTSDILVNPVLTLDFGSPFLNSPVKPTVYASDAPPVLTKKPQETDNVNSTVTWYLNDLAGGTEFELPCNISMPTDYTPMGYPLILKATLTSDGRETVEGQIVVEWIYDKKVPAKTVEPANYISTAPKIDGISNYVVFAGYDEDHDGRIDPDKTYPVTYTFNNNTAAGQGKRAVERIEIIDYLPAGATFDPAENPGWAWKDQGSGVIAYSGPDALVALNLRFPNGEADKDYINKADYKYYVYNPAFDETGPGWSYEYALQTYVRLSGEEVPGEIYSKSPVKTQRSSGLSAPAGHTSRLAVDEEIFGDYWFYSALHNSMKATKLTGAVISDDKLDQRLQFIAFTVSMQQNAITGWAVAQYRVAGQSAWTDYRTVTAADFKYETRPSGQLRDRAEYCFESEHAGARYTDYFSLPAGLVIDGLRLVIPEMAPGGTVYLDAGARLRNGEGEKIPRGDTTILADTTDFYFDRNGVKSALIGSDTAWHDIIPYQPKFRGMKTIDGLAIKYVGQTFTVSNRLRYTDFDKQDAIDFNGGQIIDILPQGMMYIPGSMSFTNLNGQTLSDMFDNIEPVVVYDYRGTGQTALIWNLKGTTDISWYKGEYIAYYSYKVEVLETCRKGNNTLTGYFHWPQYTKISASNNNQSTSNPYQGYSPFDDTLDLNGNSIFTEKFLRCELVVDYQPPTAVVAAKGAMGSYNKTYLYAPANAYSHALTSAGFRLDVVNYSLTDLADFTVFDLLPYVGDKALVVNQAGVYVSRGTQFDVRMTGPVVINETEMRDRFDVYYALEDPGIWDGIANYDGKAIWLTASQITDWDAVRAFKLVLKGSMKFEKDAGMSLIVPVEMPPMTGLQVSDIAYNSFAINSGISWLEAIKAGIQIVDADVSISKKSNSNSYTVGDTVNFTLVVTNESMIEVTNARVVDIIPAELDFISCSRADSSYNAGTRELEINLGNLAPMQNAPVTVVCRASEAAIGITNKARVSINEDEHDETNNEAECKITVVDSTHPTGELIIRKELAGEWGDWGVDDDTVFRARLWDDDYKNYLRFYLQPDGSYLAGGNTGDESGDPVEFVSFSVNKPAKLTNLWSDIEYRVDEAVSAHYTVEGPEYDYRDNHGTIGKLAEDGLISAKVTNNYEHAVGDLVISKKLAGYPDDHRVSASTVFYARVTDSDRLAEYTTTLLFEKTGLSSYYCVGNDTKLSKTGYTDKSTAEILALLEDGTFTELIAFDAGHPAVVQNLWETYDGNPLTYKVEEVLSDGGAIPTGAPYTVSYVGNGEKDKNEGLAFEHSEGVASSNIMVEITNTYERGAGSLVVRKELSGFPGDSAISGDTMFYARVMGEDGEYLIFDQSNTCTGSSAAGTAFAFSVNMPAVLRNIPTGFVTVLETPGDFTVSYSEENIRIMDDERAYVTVTNSVAGSTSYNAAIYYTKLVIGDIADRDGFTFVLTEVTGPDGAATKTGGYADVRTNVSPGLNGFTAAGLSPGLHYFTIQEEETEGWISDGTRMIVEVKVSTGGIVTVTNLSVSDVFINWSEGSLDDSVLYPYKVKYYKNSAGSEENLLGTTDGITRFPERYRIREADVTKDLGENWIDAKKPTGYRTISVRYTIITVDPEKNVVIVVYVTNTSTDGLPDNPPDPPYTPPTVPPETPNGDDNPSDNGNTPGDDDPLNDQRVQGGTIRAEGGNDRSLPPVSRIEGNTIVYVDEEHYLELGEDGVPLGQWRWDAELGEWIFDEFPPLGDLPQTGHAGIPGVIILALCGSALGCGLSWKRGERRGAGHTKLNR